MAPVSLSGHFFCDGDVESNLAVSITVVEHLTTIRLERLPSGATRTIASVSPEVAAVAVQLMAAISDLGV